MCCAVRLAYHESTTTAGVRHVPDQHEKFIIASLPSLHLVSSHILARAPASDPPAAAENNSCGHRHGFQTAVVRVGPGLKFDGALEDLTAHWTTTALDETAQIEFEGEGAGLLSVSRHDVAGMWVAFFSRCQRDRCWHVGCFLLEMSAISLLAGHPRPGQGDAALQPRRLHANRL